MPNAFGELLVGSFGGYLALDMTFGARMLMAAEPQLRFLQFVTVQTAPGEKAGKIVSIPIVGTQDLSATTALTEGTVITVERLIYATGGITLAEYGRGYGYSGKLNILSWWDIDAPTRGKLVNNYAKTSDALARAKYFEAASVGTFISVALGPTGTPGTIYPTATGVGTPTDELTFNVAEHAKDQLAIRNVPKFMDDAGEYYVGLFTTRGLRGLKHDPNWINAVTYGDSRRLYRGEVGELDGVRYMETNNIAQFAPAGGAASYEQGIIFGQDAVGRAVALEMELRLEPNYQTDFGRQMALAWLSVEGYGVLIKEHVQTVHCLPGKYNVQ